jgi:hypothetical protein
MSTRVSLAIVWKAVRLVDDESNGLVPLGNLETFHHGGVNGIDDGGLFTRVYRRRTSIVVFGMSRQEQQVPRAQGGPDRDEEPVEYLLGREAGRI